MPTSEEREMLSCQTRQWTTLLTNTKRGEISSAVKVALGGRQFLATAAHVLANGELVSVHPESDGWAKKGIVRVFRNDKLDVALAELSSDVGSTLGAFAGSAELLCLSEHGSSIPVVTAGFPSATFSPTKPYRSAVASQTHFTDTIPAPDWPTNLERPPKVGQDIFIDYPEEAFRFFESPGRHFSEDASTPEAMLHPRGMSGGGIWLANIREMTGTGVRIADTRLLGIMTSFLENRRLMRGTAITHWLDLVERNYPDLQSCVSEIRKQGLDSA